jgi:predicted SAM-dependent methyltransferase
MRLDTDSSAVGAIKNEAFKAALAMCPNAEVVIELDHDDLLTEDAVEAVLRTFQENDSAQFVYSDAADFGRGEPTYHNHETQKAWKSNGWKFYDHKITSRLRQLAELETTNVLVPRSWPASPQSLSQIHWAPNHLRAWRRSAYLQLGGHDKDLTVCDDHELLIRTALRYGFEAMLHIPRCLYLYRVTGENTWIQRNADIQQSSNLLCQKHLPELVEMWSRGKERIDICGGINPTPGWRSVDKLLTASVACDLNERWPFSDGSIYAVRAYDALEHLRDPIHVMREIHRVLVPGGWLLSRTPSTDGRGAFQDPTHVSFWNENSFWYYTREDQRRFIARELGDVQFQASVLQSLFPSAWYRENHIPYVDAHLWKAGSNTSHLPGVRS